MLRPSQLLFLRQTARLKKPFPPSIRPSSGSRGTPPPNTPIKSFAYYLTPAAAFAYFLYDENQPQNSFPSTVEKFPFWSPTLNTQNVTQEPQESEVEPYRMTGPVPPIAPGRPETLTKEEEAKLKELWSAVLKVFGVSTAEDAVLTEGEGRDDKTVEEVSKDLAATSISPENGEPKKKEKKSFSLLRSKNKERDSSPAPAASTTVSTTNSALAVVKVDEKDDKHGQTKDFKAALSTQTPAELRAAFWSMVKCDNPDGLLLRFLRARKWDVDKALIMMVGTLQWRAIEMKVEEIVRKGENAAGDNDFMKQLRVGKSFLHGWDKYGRPICHVRVRLHRAGEESEDSLERYIVYVMETARLMLNAHVDTATVIFDMTSFSLANMDYVPLKFLIKCFEAHYPESLGVCLVHKAPWIFQGIWNIIKGWLDPVVASKIHFTKTQEDLEQFISKEHIIKELGGPEDWEYSYLEPSQEEDVAMQDKETLEKLKAERDAMVKNYEALTRSWILELPETSSGETPNALEALSSPRIKDVRFGLAKQLRDGYWKMDKYVRGRTYYDRAGIIGPNGTIQFYPAKDQTPATVEATVAATVAPPIS